MIAGEIKRREFLDNLEVGVLVEAELDGNNWQLMFTRKDLLDSKSNYYDFKGISNDEELAITYHCNPRNVEIVNGRIIQKHLLSVDDYFSSLRGTENYEIIKAFIKENKK